MSVTVLKPQGGEENSRAVERGSSLPNQRRRSVVKWLGTALAGIAMVVFQSQAARAQAPTPTPTPITNACPSVMFGQNLFRVPEIKSNDHKLRGTLVLSDEQEWVAERVPVSAPTEQSRSQCVPQYVRTFREYGASPTMAAAPSGPYSKGSYALPRPGPTLRARVGDLVQLTFINEIDTSNFGNSIDRGERGIGGGCDESSPPAGAQGTGYPGTGPNADKYPDCFHGSSTGNIHYHGTHTNPNSTGDNVFLEIRPSLRGKDGKPIVTPDSVKEPFERFFANCEAHLNRNVLSEWPKTWSDLPSDWTKEQERLLKQYDDEMEKKYGNKVQKLWPVDEAQLKEGAWPQYYIGAYPYCFRLPLYAEKSWQASAPAASDLATSGGG
ncbi:MAG: hypothetical protein ACREDR_07880, partial [Blastocatellia bacterium]